MHEGQSDSERLLAEALRAQAIRAPVPDVTEPATTPNQEPATENGVPTDRLLGLLSGSDHQHELLSGRFPDVTGPAAPGAVLGSFPAGAGPVARPPRPTGTSRLPSVPPRTSVWWFLLLAVLLGLAAGVIAALFTLF